MNLPGFCLCSDVPMERNVWLSCVCKMAGVVLLCKKKFFFEVMQNGLKQRVFEEKRFWELCRSDGDIQRDFHSFSQTQHPLSGTLLLFTFKLLFITTFKLYQKTGASYAVL